MGLSSKHVSTGEAWLHGISSQGLAIYTQQTFKCLQTSTATACPACGWIAGKLSWQCVSSGGVLVQFEEMYEQKRKEVNKAAEKFEKQLKAAKKSGSKANTDKVTPSPGT